MKNIVFRFWIINLLVSVVLFVIYRIAISQTTLTEGNSFEKWMQILELLLNIGFSLIYLVAMVSSSFVVLLNLIEKIRNNFYLSLLTFLGIPSLWVTIILIDTHLKNLIIFSIIYIILTTIEFFLFRKKVNNIKLNK